MENNITENRNKELFADTAEISKLLFQKKNLNKKHSVLIYKCVKNVVQKKLLDVNGLM
jgi:hypothetical protein